MFFLINFILFLFYLFFSFYIIVICYIKKNLLAQKLCSLKKKNCWLIKKHIMCDLLLTTFFVFLYLTPKKKNKHYSNKCYSDDLLNEREKKKLLQEEMEATLHDIQNM